MDSGDQLQDVLAPVYSDPDRVKRQILLHSEHQYEEGDVQHWWHPPHRGIRTRITDDPVVPALCHGLDYIQGTGDWDILDEMTHYFGGRTPEEGNGIDTIYRRVSRTRRAFMTIV